MRQQCQPGSSTPSSSVKRRRGRPRKDESFSHSQTLNPNKPLSYTQIDLAKGKSALEKPNTSGNIGEDQNQMIGRVITGVLEGAFDAGYLLHMKVAGAQTCLKGLVFQPGKFVPITAENDIAPLARMYTRMDLCVPAFESPAQIQVSAPKSSDDRVLEADVSKKKLLHDTEESMAKGKLELLASLSVEMELPKPQMEVGEGEKAFCDESHGHDQDQDQLLEPLAKKPRNEEANNSEEMKAATTLNQLENLEAIRERGSI